MKAVVILGNYKDSKDSVNDKNHNYIQQSHIIEEREAQKCSLSFNKMCFVAQISAPTVGIINWEWDLFQYLWPAIKIVPVWHRFTFCDHKRAAVYVVHVVTYFNSGLKGSTDISFAAWDHKWATQMSCSVSCRKSSGLTQLQLPFHDIEQC